MPYLLDTCIVSAFFRKNPSVIQKIHELSPEDIKISTITVMEIEYGLQLNSTLKPKLQPLWVAFKGQVEILQFSKGDAFHSAYIRSVLIKKGQPIGPYDILLAGMSRNRNQVFVTDNMSEFRRVEDLLIENWINNH